MGIIGGGTANFEWQEMGVTPASPGYSAPIYPMVEFQGSVAWSCADGSMRWYPKGRQPASQGKKLLLLEEII